MHRDLIISLTAQFRIPAIYPYRYFAEAGGLVSYGVHAIDQFRRAAEYVSRILRGAKPADLPVQAPTKFELVINLKTAKALGLVIPRILLAGAEQVIRTGRRCGCLAAHRKCSTARENSHDRYPCDRALDAHRHVSTGSP